MAQTVLIDYKRNIRKQPRSSLNNDQLDVSVIPRIMHSTLNVNVMLVKKSAIYCTLFQQMFTFIIVMNLNWISILFSCVNEAL